MTYANNPDFREVFHSTVHKARFYTPSDSEAGYHVSRVVGAQAIDVYAQSGATKEVVEGIANALISLFEDESSKAKIRTDGTLLAQNLLYRLRYPIDEDCMLRMGAVLTFMESETEGTEPHDNLKAHYTEKKVAMAKADPDLYAFFLSLGAAGTPSYKDLLDTLQDPSYLKTRRETLQSLLPSNLSLPK